MKFSILIPIYNVEKYLEECLDSVMNQDYSDFEVVLVDDGSIDNSGLICDYYQERYPNQVVVVHKKNQGLISARRIGIANARGEFSLFVDSDDMVELSLLKDVSKCIDNHKNVDMVMFSFRYIRNGKLAENNKHVYEDGQVWTGEQKKDLYNKLISSSSIDALFIKAIRTSILKSDPIEYEKYYSFNMSEDTLQSIHPLTVARKIAYINKPLYFYRIIDTSISHNYSIESLKKNNTNHVYQMIYDTLPRWGLDDEESKQKLQARWFNEAMYTFCKYYESALEKREKQVILDFNWDTMIPFEVEMNPYYSETYWNVYKNYKNNNTSYLWRFFVRRKIYNQYKKLKHHIKSM